MSYKNRGRKKEYCGKFLDEMNHQPSYSWRGGKFVDSKGNPYPKDPKKFKRVTPS